ncbi:MAG: 50S ribosomal protein L24 [Candidatus Paceibacterota bacterium]
MKLKKGDNVIVITGKDKGKKGKIVKAIPAEDKVVVEGVNIRKKHQKAKRQGQKGQTIEMTFPVHVSNVMLVDPQSGKPTKIGKRLEGDRYVRVAKISDKKI